MILIFGHCYNYSLVMCKVVSSYLYTAWTDIFRHNLFSSHISLSCFWSNAVTLHKIQWAYHISRIHSWWNLVIVGRSKYAVLLKFTLWQMSCTADGCKCYLFALTIWRDLNYFSNGKYKKCGLVSPLNISGSSVWQGSQLLVLWLDCAIGSLY